VIQPQRVLGLREAVCTALDTIQRQAPGTVVGALVLGVLLLEGHGPRRRGRWVMRVIQSPALHEATASFLMNDAGRALCQASREAADA
jgi:hypothetical protein